MLSGDCSCLRTLPRLRPGCPLSRTESIRSAGALVPGNANVLDHPPVRQGLAPSGRARVLSGHRSYLPLRLRLRALRPLTHYCARLRRGFGARAESLRHEGWGKRPAFASLSLVQGESGGLQLFFSGRTYF